MSSKFRHKKQSTQKVVQQSRKQLRKEKRLGKKIKRNEYFQNRNKQSKTETINKNNLPGNDKIIKSSAVELLGTKEHDSSDDELYAKTQKVADVLIEQRQNREKESKLRIKLEKEMSLRRKKQLKDANQEEDRVIKKLEKQLKLNKRKSKSIPKSFIDEGLDYLLEVCDSEKLQGVAKTEMNLKESGSEFEDDFATITGRKKVKTKKAIKEQQVTRSESDDETEGDFSDSDDEMSDGYEVESDRLKQKILKSKSLNKEESKNSLYNDSITVEKSKRKVKNNEYDSEDEDIFSEEECIDNIANNTNLHDKQSNTINKDKQKKIEGKIAFDLSAVSSKDSENTNSDSDLEESVTDVESGEEYEGNVKFKNNNRKRSVSTSSEQSGSDNKKMREIDDDDISEEEKGDELWEDIYGRTRDKKGNVIQATTGKYIPPHLRAELTSGDAKRVETLSRLRKQLKGLINRLAENNMHGIASQIDELYMRNSRNDMNETLTSLIFESLIAPMLTSERLVMEHVMLVAILHANVGMEVGAHFLQSVVEKFDEMYHAGQNVENKSLDNVVLIISHLYNFKVFNAVLMYNILDKLSEAFTEKEVELILLVLRNVGFSLRKDSALSLKDLILRLQKKANESSELRNNTRVRFMLDILLAVKNNNMAKIPQYDPTYSEHLKKLIKTMIHKGKYITELKITLEDLLKAEERGRWWIVGSAWTGNTDRTSSVQNDPVKTDVYSSTILELARKQRMNTDTRRNVFCIVMTAEDYMDAFEKLLRLGLKAGQEQEIIHVLIHCVLQEKVFNPYYAHLANQLCLSDRKHQLTIQFNVWDRLKQLSDLGPTQITNLAKFLSHLLLEKSLPLSVLKVVQFSDMDKACVKLMRQLLLSTLLHDCTDTMAAVFARVSRPPKLRMFRESVRLFLHHFVLRNVKDESDEAVKLRERVKLAETALTSVDTSKLIL